MTRKSRKHSKGQSATSVPDCGHDVIDTMGDLEGLGTSEMTVSEDAYAPKRKGISLNVDGYDSFDVSVRVFSLSKISSSEKKDLELKLQLELEQVRVLQKKIASLSSSTVSPTSDIRSCGVGLRRPVPQTFNRSSSVSVQNGVHTKRGTVPNFEPQKRSAPSTFENAVLMKQCQTLLKRLMDHKFGYIFNTPVDVVKFNIPDYFTVIKHPMDLGTVKRNLTSARYSGPFEFAADVRLTFSNAMKYNPPGNEYHFMAETLSKLYEGKWKSIEKKLPGDSKTHSVPARSGANFETKISIEEPPLKKNLMPVDNRVKLEPPKCTMTDEEKGNIGLRLEALQGEFPESIVDFLTKHSSIAGQGSEDEIEIDMEAFSDEALFKLRQLLDEHVLEKQKNQSNAEPCEIELHNDSGFSTSSLQPCKGNDEAEDEDVDIVGGNDPPISSYPPVEIENDVFGNSKPSPSSSSSRDSVSSSSDSDLDSSSESESDGAKATLPEENLDAGADLQQKQSLVNDPDMEDKFTNGVSEIEQNTPSKPDFAELDDNEEGESAPSEKLYRAALLKNRFADTILKACEKTFKKSEKRDPGLFQREREELERRQREEKARLQAEAKVAEEARKKAEAEAAAEARRKRELEREAARQKLQEMEKTVDINENDQFLKDLEMLRATSNGEDLPNLTDEASPDHSENMLGSFGLQGSSNPLEQLGLYMKVDEEDDEYEAPKSVNDGEEGEIDQSNFRLEF